MGKKERRAEKLEGERGKNRKKGEKGEEGKRQEGEEEEWKPGSLACLEPHVIGLCGRKLP